MRGAWEKLNPKQRRLTVIAGVLVAFSGLIALMPGGDRERAAKREDPVRAILTDRQSGDVRFETLVAQLQNIRDENKELNNNLERMRRDMERMEAGELGPRVTREMGALEERLKGIEKEMQFREDDGSYEVVVGEAPVEVDLSKLEVDETGAPIMQEPTRATGGFVQDQAQPGTPAGVWDTPSSSAMNANIQAGDTEAGTGSSESAQSSTIRVIGAVADETDKTEDEDADNGVYLPAGSILTGTLITGMDAPTGSGARKEPFPALLRIKHEAILPNRFRADVRECFVIVGGYGDLSSERAYLRGESISCIRNDGKVVESALNSFTVGEDGKAGLRGRLVSKQGQMLAKSLTAGVLQGFSSAFGKTPVPTLSLDATSTPLYQQAFSNDSLQSGVVNGVGSAFDRLAQFYIDQAEGMFPVIEVDAGREVEIVMISGGKLAIK